MSGRTFLALLIGVAIGGVSAWHLKMPPAPPSTEFNIPAPSTTSRLDIARGIACTESAKAGVRRDVLRKEVITKILPGAGTMAMKLSEDRRSLEVLTSVRLENGAQAPLVYQIINAPNGNIIATLDDHLGRETLLIDFESKVALIAHASHFGGPLGGLTTLSCR